jgi:outer membrane biosynthesis protein TonB
VNRYILWSIVFHIAVVLGGAVLAPMSGLITSAPRSEMIISVGLVDSPNMGGSPPPAASAQEPAQAAPPELAAPEPALDADLAVKPIADLTKEKVAEPKKKDPPKKKEEPKKSETKTAEAKEDTKSKQTETSQQLASTDTAGGTHGAISDGAGGSGDVWGVETGPSVSPYHRRGFASIRSNWRNPAVGNKPIKCSVRFDRAAVRAVQLTESWEQFPNFWPEDEQVIILDFEYRP